MDHSVPAVRVVLQHVTGSVLKDIKRTCVGVTLTRKERCQRSVVIDFGSGTE